MASSININQNNNDITLQDNNRSISITDNNAGTTVNVTQPVTSVVTVAAIGPQGPMGPTSGSFTGSFSGSFIGNLTGTASYATSASYALTASFATSASYVSGTVVSPGLDTQIIFNNGGVLGATGSFVYSGSNVGIGTNFPPSKLSVVGKLSLTDGINSIFIGVDAGKLDDGTSNNNIAIGSSSLANNIAGTQNVAIGNNSQASSSVSNNTSIGTNTLFFNTTIFHSTKY